jgi:hypothetical protein
LTSKVRPSPNTRAASHDAWAVSVAIPRVYGSEAKCRSAIDRYIRSGDDLLDQAIGVAARVKAASEARHPESFEMDFIEFEWVLDLRKWATNSRRSLAKYLQDQFPTVLPALVHSLPPESGKPRHHVSQAEGETWLRGAVGQLRSLQSVLGVSRNVSSAGPSPARFEELHVSGLVAADVIDDQARDLLAPRTPKQLSDAIGAAKELTEATLRASLDRLGERYTKNDGLPTLMAKWRKAVATSAPPNPLGHSHLDDAQRALGNIVVFLGQCRNTYGSGHGRTQYPPGLSVRHARLAADAAETCIRFIVTTMDDLHRLPP